jgi:hypothetical protein
VRGGRDGIALMATGEKRARGNGSIGSERERKRVIKRLLSRQVEKERRGERVEKKNTMGWVDGGNKWERERGVRGREREWVSFK